MQSSCKRIRRLTGLALSIALTLSGGVAPAEEPESFNWSITPYLWASKTTLDLALNDTSVGGAAVSFNDLLDVLDTAIQVNIEGGKWNWSGFVVSTYIETSDSDQRGLQTGNVLQIDSDSTQTVIDAAAVFWPGGVGTPLSIFGGVRYTDFDDRYRFSLDGNELNRRRSNEDYYDALFGARYRFDFSERWSLLTRADISFGDSEGSWLVNGLFAYKVGKRQRNRILFGYQYKQAEFDDRTLTREYTWHGPIAGFNFRF